MAKTPPALDDIDLGPTDSNDDDNLDQYFISFGDFKRIEKKSLFVAVGPKGTGKSAIKKYFKFSRSNDDKPTIIVDDSYGFSINQLQTQSPAQVKNKLKAYFVSIILNHLLSTKSLSKENRNKLQKLSGDVPFLEKWAKRAVSPLKINIWVIEYAIKDLFPDDKRAEVLTLVDPEVTTIIRNCIKDDLWIVIDDIDTVFTADSIKSSLTFIEGLIYAASDLNISLFKKQVWLVLLLRSEIFEELRRKAPELDKELGYVWKMMWERDSLMAFLAERIRFAFNDEKGKDRWRYFALLFNVDAQKSAIQLADYLFERSINGPRDVLELIDLAQDMAVKRGASRISLKDIEDSESQYGDNTLNQLTSNFQRVYEDIDLVVDKLFRGQKQSYTREELDKHINDQFLTAKKAREGFKSNSWIFKSTPFRIIQILYTVGIIGYLDSTRKRYLFALEKPSPDLAQPGMSFSIHTAFQKFLELKS